MLQVQSIRDSLASHERLKVCYSLASPENRVVTGPYSRFAEMIMMPPYDQLATCQDWQLGEAQIENEYAAVLVSTMSSDGEPTAFRFILRQHETPPYQGCWLTEAVHVLEQIRSEEMSIKPPKPAGSGS